MPSVVYFLLWAALIFVMLRFGCGAHVMGHGHGKAKKGGETARGDARWIAPAKETDPVCNMTVDTVGGKSAIYEGRAYYFCSQECREKFEASPKSYPNAGSSFGAIRTKEPGYEHSR